MAAVTTKPTLDAVISGAYLGAVTDAAQNRSTTVDCNIQTLSSESCFIDNLNVTDCKNVTIECVNDASKAYAVCTPAALQQLAGAVAASTIPNATDQAKVQAALVAQGFKSSTADASTFQQDIETYVSLRCEPRLIATQQLSLPTLSLSGCDNDSIVASNSVRQSALCAAGALSTLVTSAGLAPPPATPPPLLSAPALIAIIVIGALVILGAFIGGGFAARAQLRKGSNITVGATGPTKV